MSEQEIKHVGYIGLGIMGSAMAKRLIDAGNQLTVWNRTAEKMKPVIEAGASAATSPAEVAAAGPQVICINVSDTPDVQEVIFGDQGIASKANQGLIIIDHSTINPLATQQMARQLAEQNVTLLDAPVSGGDSGAKAGTLSIMVGGDQAAYETCLPMFEVVGQRVTHLGASGMGQLCKACNQIAVVSNLMGVCEAIGLARQAGLDEKKMIEVVSSGAGGSWQLANLGPKIAEGDFQPGFMIDLVLKDLNIVHETARDSKMPLFATPLAESLFRAVANENEGGKLGTQAMMQAFEKLMGVKSS